MSNPNDPKKPNPDPNAPTNPTAGAPSAFDFTLPGDVGSFSELPPVPTPDGSQGELPPLPPVPGAGGRGASFDFVNVPDGGSLGDFGVGVPPSVVAVLGAGAVPPLPPAPPPESKGGKGNVEPPPFVPMPKLPPLPVATDETLLTLPKLPDLLPPAPADGLTELTEPGAPPRPAFKFTPPTAPDLGALFPPVPPLDLPPVAELPEVPLAEDALDDLDLAAVADAELPPLPVPGGSAVGLGQAEEPPLADAPSSFTLSAPELPPLKPAPSSPDIKLEPYKPASSGSVPDIGTLAARANAPDSTPTLSSLGGPVQPPSTGSTPSLSSIATNPPAGAKGGEFHSSPSFEFQLPDEVKTYSDMPPVRTPDGSQAQTPSIPSIPSIDLPAGSNPFVSAADLELPDLPSDSKVPLGRPEAPVAPASGWLEAAPPAVPAAPASGWLDGPTPPTPAADLLGAATGGPDSSDIFAGARGAATVPGESSDVISATSGAVPGPALPATGPSDVSLAHNPLPGGSTLPDADADDLPLADAVEALDPDSGPSLLPLRRGDDESIHDMPSPGEGGPLFDLDSATLADAPDPPRGPADEPDYGAELPLSSDASSILSDLSNPDLDVHTDASSVRVESPGLSRTLTGGPSDQGFDLTVDEGVPPELLDADDPDAGDWHQQSGSDLLGGRAAAPPEAGRVDHDADLTADDPSLSSSPSSIFSDTNLPKGSSGGVAAEATVPSRPLPPNPGAPTRRVPGLSSADFELPEFPPRTTPAGPPGDADNVDFDAAVLTDADQRTQDSPLAAMLGGELPDDSGEAEATMFRTQAAPPSQTDATREPEISMDYVSESAETRALLDPEAPPVYPTRREPERSKKEPKVKKTREPAPADEPARTKATKAARVPAATADPTGTTELSPEARRGRGLLAGALVGALACGGALAGIYYGGVIPNGEKGTGPTTVQNGKSNGGASGDGKATTPAALDPQQAFAAGDTAKALEFFKANPPATAADKADAGYVRVFAKAQALGDGPAAANDADLKDAREELKAIIDSPDEINKPGGLKRTVKARVALGVSYELSGDLQKAREEYKRGIEAHPKYAATFEALLDKLDALEGAPAGGTSRRPEPRDAELLLVALVLVLQDEQKAEDPEPGVFYWKAVNLANAGKYAEAVKQIEAAKKAHQARARAVAGRGLNPLSDPLEQIFARSCDELKSHWELKGSLYASPALAAAIKKEGAAKALERLLAAEKDVTAARDTVKKLEGDVAKLAKDAKEATDGKGEAEKKLKTAETDLKAAVEKFDTASAALTAAEKDVKAQKDALAALAEAVRGAERLPEKWTPADLLAATKSLAGRATGPDLKVLIPPGMAAVGGGLTAGQLIDIAARLKGAEAEAKRATEALALETKKLTDKYEADARKLKDDQAAELKKLTDTYAADTKKLRDDHAEAVKKLKDGTAEEVKKATDKYEADAKKLKETYETATAKLKEEQAALLRAEQDKVEAAKRAAAAREVEFQKQLAGAVTPGQVMDLWLPRLTDLRRAADGPPALDAARKAIASSAADSEDLGRARAVAGMAHLVQGDLEPAKDMFLAAKRVPAYKAGAGKPWVVAVDRGLDAVTDPSALYRVPVALPLVDVRAASAFLNRGILSYRAGSYADAVRALQGATKNNPADPLGWYFLGAAQWALGNEEQARKEFAQGAEREKTWPVPARVVSDGLSLIQGAARDAIDRARP